MSVLEKQLAAARSWNDKLRENLEQVIKERDQATAEVATGNRARMELCKLVGLEYQVDWPELVGRVQLEINDKGGR